VVVVRTTPEEGVEVSLDQETVLPLMYLGVREARAWVAQEATVALLGGQVVVAVGGVVQAATMKALLYLAAVVVPDTSVCARWMFRGSLQ